MSSQGVRLSAAAYLNSRPLIHGLDVGHCAPGECARRLDEGEADVALVPIASVARAGDWTVVPGPCVATRGAVQSVLLLADCDVKDLDVVALDASSRTSAILVRLVLRHILGGREPRYEQRAPEKLDGLIGGRRGALVIGDAALELVQRRRFATCIDLGSAWFEMTSLPFVFAVWAAREGILTRDLCARLGQAAADGIAAREEIARTSPLGHDLALRYLSQHLRFTLGPEERAGAEEFLRRAAEAGLLPRTKLRLFGEPAPDHDVSELLDRGARGERLSVAEVLALHDRADLMAIGSAAHARRNALHPKPIVTYIVDRNINYTNVCTTSCRFCAFFRPVGHKEGYVLDRATLAKKMTEVRDAGGVQILLQGGLNPGLPLEWYEDLFRWMKREFKMIALHALSPEEIVHLSGASGLDFEGVLRRLHDAGMDSLPGGGAEILVDRVRRRIARQKCTSAEWLEVMRVAHRLGLRTTSTMMYAHVETPRERALHLIKLRDLQDETGRFTAFILWPFQEGNTRLAGDHVQGAAPEYLRMVATARLALDNIPNLQASWPTMGPAVGQVALAFGANDFGSVMFEENVVSSAGTLFSMDAASIEEHVVAAGYQPKRRNMRYELLG
ncbi:MAG: dehypoxanthine futalosine cyclase [Deltaproteobacteria bacterium]|nr:dehypoxanthine futalosine cyclase [Deltaproteobacteria bacterium]